MAGGGGGVRRGEGGGFGGGKGTLDTKGKHRQAIQKMPFIIHDNAPRTTFDVKFVIEFLSSILITYYKTFWWWRR